MEGFSGNKNQRNWKLQAINNGVSRIFVPNDRRGHQYFASNSYAGSDHPYASDNLDSASLIRYLRARSPTVGNFPDSGELFSSSPSINDARNPQSQLMRHGYGLSSARVGSALSAVENLMVSPTFGSPAVKQGEDVLVMDGIPVTGRSRAQHSGGYRTEICRAWENSGSCRLASQCPFAHGKEELHPGPTRPANKNKYEAQVCRLYTITGSCTHGSDCRFLHQQQSVPLTAADHQSPEAASPFHLNTIAHHGSAGSRSNSGGQNMIRAASRKFNCWLPQDDGIVAILPPFWCHDGNQKVEAGEEETEALIQAVLYGDGCMSTGRKTRLPVFTKLSSNF